jgi:hypothetical protein
LTHSTLPGHLLATAAGAALYGPEIPLRFLAARPPGAGALAHWKDTTAYVDRVLASPEASSSPLVIGAAARLLAATALVTFPHNAPVSEARQDRRDGSTATLRRAATLMDEHAHEDLSMADIAAAASVTPAPSSSPSAATWTRRQGPTCAVSGSNGSAPSSWPPVPAAVRRSPLSPPAGGFANLSRFTAYYVRHTASRPAVPCGMASPSHSGSRRLHYQQYQVSYRTGLDERGPDYFLATANKRVSGEPAAVGGRPGLLAAQREPCQSSPCIS